MKELEDVRGEKQEAFVRHVLGGNGYVYLSFGGGEGDAKECSKSTRPMT